MIYNLLEWGAGGDGGRRGLIMIGLSNTVDLPERVMQVGVRVYMYMYTWIHPSMTKITPILEPSVHCQYSPGCRAASPCAACASSPTPTSRYERFHSCEGVID